MPRYYFDLRDGDALAMDEEGLELLNLEAAQEEAALSLADMTRDALRGYPSHGMAVEVRDDTGPLLQVRVTFEAGRLTN